MGRGKRIKVSWEEQPLRQEGGMEIGKRGCTSGRRGRDKEGDGDWKRGKRGLEKRETGFGKEGEKAGHRAAYSLKQEGTICLQFCCVISKKAVDTE